jgi:hypothetical protein
MTMFFMQDAPLTLREYAMSTTVTLADIFRRVFDLLRRHSNAVVFGGQAVNMYVAEPRMTRDVDVMSTNAEALAAEILDTLRHDFHIAVRLRRAGKGLRIYQATPSDKRPLIDIRPVDGFPSIQVKGGVQIVDAPDLVAMKIVSYADRRNSAKGHTDRRDLIELLKTFPLLRTSNVVEQLLTRWRAPEKALHAWEEIRHAVATTPRRWMKMRRF